jgi:hypothetical protein
MIQSYKKTFEEANPTKTFDETNPKTFEKANPKKTFEKANPKKTSDETNSSKTFDETNPTKTFQLRDFASGQNSPHLAKPYIGVQHVNKNSKRARFNKIGKSFHKG